MQLVGHTFGSTLMQLLLEYCIFKILSFTCHKDFEVNLLTN